MVRRIAAVLYRGEGELEVFYTKEVPKVLYLGTLLEYGRFALLMPKENCDQRNLIESKMKSRRGNDCRPFLKEDAKYIMYGVALGMDWLHSRNIVYKDLKVSNVLVKEFASGYPSRNYVVADFECSIGVVGTGFFRAPEILQVLKEQRLSRQPEVFSEVSDVYSYRMTCYEILTGKLLFEGHRKNDYDLVLSGQSPELPMYVADWTLELLSRCWDSNPTARPAFGEILDLLSTNSAEVRKCANWLIRHYGKNFRSLHFTRTTNS